MTGIISMTKWSALLVLALSACGDHGEGVADADLGQKGVLRIDSSIGEVGGVAVDSNQARLESLGLPLSRRTINMEGDEYQVVDIEISEEVVVSCLLDLAGSVHEISSNSRKLRDERGAGVGNTLSELKKIYPNGTLLVGAADARFANFINGTKLIFALDQSGIDESCFETGERECEIDEATEVSEIRISRYVHPVDERG